MKQDITSDEEKASVYDCSPPPQKPRVMLALRGTSHSTLTGERVEFIHYLHSGGDRVDIRFTDKGSTLTVFMEDLMRYEVKRLAMICFTPTQVKGEMQIPIRSFPRGQLTFSLDHSEHVHITWPEGENFYRVVFHEREWGALMSILGD